MFVAGVDVGSVTSKAVLLDPEGRIAAFSKVPTTHDRGLSGRLAFLKALQDAGVPEARVRYVVSTGYGRKAVTFSDETRPEILCHAEGTRQIFPDVRSIIDIGGQDSKVIDLDGRGMVRRFQMNDKCAAGTGRFLEVLAERILGLDLEALGRAALSSRDPCSLTSVCTVFAESEIVSLLSQGKRREDIACGLSRAIARRVVAMGLGEGVTFVEPVCFSGGVALNGGVVEALKQELKKPIFVPAEPQITAALGAAVWATKKSGTNRSE